MTDNHLTIEQLEQIAEHSTQFIPWQMSALAKQLLDTMRENERLKKELHDIGFISNKHPDHVPEVRNMVLTQNVEMLGIEKSEKLINDILNKPSQNPVCAKCGKEMIVHGGGYICLHGVNKIQVVIGRSKNSVCQHNWLGGGCEGKFHNVHCTKCGAAHPDNYSAQSSKTSEK